jgi:membrane associated rhomboid family serine protease
MTRRLLNDFREFPATMTLCSLWVLVFALMIGNQWAQGAHLTLGRLILGVRGGHPFGELTLRGFYQGEIWRPLTATFVHYGLLHLGMNLFMMYQLGGLVESWYGPWQFLAVYVATGYGGNLLSVLMRHALGSDPLVASGGGSTVILGLSALCAVVGRRSRTRIGAFLYSQMVWLLIATAVLGAFVPIIDNWGHAGGAMVGAAIGFAHRILIRTASLPIARWAGALGVILLIASGAAQVRADRVEATRREHLLRTARALQEIGNFYFLAKDRSFLDHAALVQESFLQSRPGPRPTPVTSAATPADEDLSLLDSSDEDFNASLKRHLARLDALRDELGTGPTARDFERLRTLLAQVLRRPPTDLKVRAFTDHLNALVRRALQNQGTA